MHLRVSEGVPRGRRVFLYHPELFNEHEEVIVYNREEFKRSYLSMQESIDFIMKSCYFFDQDRYWEIEGLWPRIMERINIINININSFYEQKGVQTYLDTYLNIDELINKDKVAESMSKVPAKPLHASWL